MTETAVLEASSAAQAGLVRVLLVGASDTETCGVRAHNQVLEFALRMQGASVRRVWWERDRASGPIADVRDLQNWIAQVRQAAEQDAPHWIVWSYSVFTYSRRGIPHLTPFAAFGLAGIGSPVVGFLHEPAYPFGRRGWRGAVWAFTQRAALLPVAKACAGLVATTEERAQWLRTRRWLPKRETRFVPVSSALPLPDGSPLTPNHALTIGVFGYGAEDFVAEPVLSAIASLRARGLAPQLLLVGAPGKESPQGRAWLAAAGRSGCRDAISFTGTLDLAEVALALAGVDIVAFPDPGGPAARKSSLAAALALAKPVVALDGPSGWRPIVEEQAVVLAARDGNDLAEQLERLARNPALRLRQGERAQAFYRREMAPDVCARRLLALFETLDSARAAAR